MTSNANEDKARAEATLENRFWLNSLRSGPNGRHFTYYQVHKELDKRNPGSAPGKVSLYRLSARPLPELLGRRASYDDIAGLSELAIERLFTTPFSRAGMRMEWLLRSAYYNQISPAKAKLLIPEAEGVLEDMDENANQEEECTIDRLARASLGAQIATYKAGADNISAGRKARMFREAQLRLAGCAELRMSILRNVEFWFTEAVLAVRMESLAYFVEYNLRNQQQCDLPAMARRIAQHPVLKAVELVTQKLGDPRIPINFAEAAGYVALNEGGGKVESYNKKAKNMIELTLKTAGYTGPVRTFAADWLPAGYDMSKVDELQAAILMIETPNKE